MKIIIATGGSGGHIFPAVSTARELRVRGHQIMFVSTPGMAEEILKENGFKFESLYTKGLSLQSFQSFFLILFLMVKSLIASFRFLKHFKPDVVAGFGGYGAFPTVFMASLMGYPTIIHEQNVVPGKANYVLSKIVRKVAISFEESKKYFNSKKTILTGCPCHIVVPRLSKEELEVRFNLSPGRLTLLVFGGSQGSHAINEKFLEAAVLLKKDLDFQVIHIAGKKDYLSLKERYKVAGVTCCLFDFLTEMNLAYKAADLVISRAGALTISEVMMFQLPAILIPYPFAGSHQKENAKVLCEIGLARMIEEKDLSAERLKEALLAMASDKSIREKAVAHAEDFFIPDAAGRLAEEVIRLKK